MRCSNQLSYVAIHERIPSGSSCCQLTTGPGWDFLESCQSVEFAFILFATMDATTLIDGSTALWGLFTSAFISSTILPGYSEAVLAYLVSQSRHDPGNLIAIASVGNTLGAMTTWCLGYWGHARLAGTGRTESRHQVAILRLKKWGLPLLLFSWLPIIGDGFCFAAGWLQMRFSHCLVMIALGKVARYAAITWALIA